VVSVFLSKKLHKQPIPVFGTGKQTRDLLYVEDCARFIVSAAMSARANGKTINAGTGKDIRIIDLARMIAGSAVPVRFVPHPHPQSEIQKLQCDYSFARKLLGWKPKIRLEEGIQKTKEWMEHHGKKN